MLLAQVTCIDVQSFHNTPFVILSGDLRYMNSAIKLCYRQYPTEPDYWGIEVVEDYGVGLPALGKFVEVKKVLSKGTKGVEFFFEGGSQKFNL